MANRLGTQPDLNLCPLTLEQIHKQLLCHCRYPSYESLPRTKTALKQGQILALECPSSAGCWGSAWKGSRNSASHIAPQQADTANERQDGSDDAAKYQEEGMQQFEALWQSRRRAIGMVLMSLTSSSSNYLHQLLVSSQPSQRELCANL